MVRMLTDALGSFSEGGIVVTRALSRGQVLELDDALAAKYVEGGYAEHRLHGPVGTYKPAG